MGLHLLAPGDDRTMGLFYGLIGAVIGFVISSIIIKPKRDIIIEKKNKE
jgi:type IV secretory pathway TrbD component